MHKDDEGDASGDTPPIGGCCGSGYRQQGIKIQDPASGKSSRRLGS
jgi:hypothetical protein